nr:hypothetical protein [uncultured Roseococcus sp.]
MTDIATPPAFPMSSPQSRAGRGIPSGVRPAVTRLGMPAFTPFSIGGFRAADRAF